MKEDVNLLLL